MVAQNFNVGTTVEYTCDEGHLLVGPTTRTCLETGFYNEFPPVCKRIQCGYPADIANGEYVLVNDSVGYLSRVVYSCEDGYEMIGRAQLACDIDERWNGPPPRCEAIQCENPPEIPNGLFESSTNDTSFGSVAEYQCKFGFKLIGPKTITCLATGQYDALPPSCEAEDLVSTTSPPSVSRTTTKFTPNRTRTRPPKPPPTTIKAETEPPKATTRSRRPLKTTERTTPQIIVAGHPQDNEIAGSSNIQHGDVPNVNIPLSIDGERREAFGAKLNLGAIIALGAFGGFVFLAAIITTIVILVRRNRSAKHYRHRASPDCNTVASFDSSSSESRNGLNRYYRQAWENLHESAGTKAALKPSNHAPLKRKETLDEPYKNSEAVTSEASKEKKRHHHHHHHHDGRQKDGRDWRDPRPPPHRDHRRY